MTRCAHGQRFEHWIPALHQPQIRSGKVACGSDRDVFETDPDLEPCACPRDCDCRDETEWHCAVEHRIPDDFQPAKNVTWDQIHHLLHRLKGWSKNP